MGSLIDLQRWLYSGAIDALNVLRTEGIGHLPALIGSAFLFGMLHALLPGHGKAVLAALYAGAGRWRGAVGSSALLIVTHVGSAVIIVLAGFAVLERTIGGAGRAVALERASQILIVLVGFWLLWRALRPQVRHAEKSGPILAFVTGLVPCPLTTFIMTYAVTQGAVAAGLVLSGAFAAGMIVTVAVFPLAAIYARSSLVSLLERSGGLRSTLGQMIGVAAALAVIALGGLPLVSSILRMVR